MNHVDEQVDIPEENDDNGSEEDTNDHESVVHSAIVLTSTTQSTPPVIFINYPPYLSMNRSIPDGYEAHTWPSETELFYHGTKRYLYNAVKNTFKRAHIKKTNKSGWNIFWGRHLEPTQYSGLLPGQKVNHFPGSFELGRKDKLCLNILKMQRKFGFFYNIIPDTFVTGGKECKLFLTELNKKKNEFWILKPPNQCCGRGIKIISSSDTFKYEPEKRYVAQKYILNPYLINGFKFDMRLYVLVTSYDPLRIYLFNNGLVRFCTQKYSILKKDIKNRFGHLTNYSINKKNKSFKTNQDIEDDGNGSKWSYQALQKYFKTQNLNPDKIHLDIAQIIIKTILCVETNLVNAASTYRYAKEACFELYGFDILLDSMLKPWLLEVNVFPSMSSSSPMDKQIKSTLIADTFHLVGIPAVDVMAAQEAQLKMKKDRTIGLTRKSIKENGFNEEQENREKKWLDALHEEESRCGHFKRIFPTVETVDFYQYFEKPRESNLFYAKHMQTNGTQTIDTKLRRESFSERFKQAKKTSEIYKT